MDCGLLTAILGWVSYWLLVLVTLVMAVVICFFARDKRKLQTTANITAGINPSISIRTHISSLPKWRQSTSRQIPAKTKHPAATKRK